MPANSPIWKGSTSLTEHKESPVWDYGESVTVTQIYEGPYATCLAAASPNGTIGTGDLASFMVARCTVTKRAGGIGRMVLVWVMGGTGVTLPTVSLPASEEDLEPFELNPKLERHPRYAELTLEEVQNVRTAVDGAADERDAAFDWIWNNGSAAAIELYDKRARGTETYYLAGFRYAVTSYYWALPALTDGGYIEALGGALSGFSCLRVADRVSLQNGVWRVTRNWLCGPSGHWDADLY